MTTRRFIDASLRHWEGFASTGWQGVPRPALIVFECISDPEERPRAVEIDEGRTEAEAKLAGMSDAELAAMVREASPVR